MDARCFVEGAMGRGCSAKSGDRVKENGTRGVGIASCGPGNRQAVNLKAIQKAEGIWLRLV